MNRILSCLSVLVCIVFFIIILSPIVLFAQQQIGLFPNIDGGFENQAAGNISSTRDSKKWSFVVNGNGQIRNITTSGGYGGGTYLSLGKSATASSGTTTTANSNEITNTNFAQNTLYIVQFYYRANAANATTPDAGSSIFISTDGTSANRISKNITLGTPTVWTKFTDTIRTNSTTQTSTGTYGITIRTPSLGTAAIVDIDNFIVYPADNATNGSPDITAPNTITNATASLSTPIQMGISWTAPTTGTDNGGYLIVRYNSTPSSNDNPLQNAVYAIGDTIANSNNGLVVYVGKNTSCIDSFGLSINNNYFYRIYTVDKAFNYSSGYLLSTNSNHPPTNYYIDATSGNDANAGTSINNPWKTINKINATTFYAGDSVLLKCNSVFTGITLRPLGVGSAGLPITIASYGSGNPPLIAADGNGLHNENGIYLFNQQYISIVGLEITNNYAATASDTVIRRGVYVLATDAGTLRGITLKNLIVHDVLGTYDSTNESGGIFINITGSNIVTKYDSLTVDGCKIYNVDRTGISNQSSWADRDMNNDYGSTPWRPSTNLVFKNNRIDSSGGNGMIVRVAQSPLIQNNIFWKCAKRYSGNAFFVFNCNDALVQYNEAAYTVYNTGDADASGFDGDYRCRRSIFQYNYSHDNDGGFAVVVCNPGGTPSRFNDSCVFRYNISQNDGHFNGNIKNEGEAITVTGQTTNTFFYNNTIYSSTDFNYAIIHRRWGNAGSVYPTNTFYYNNIFYINKANPSYSFQNSTNNTFDNNLFYNTLGGTPPTDANGIYTNPNFVNAGSGGVGISTVSGYKLASNSPCINKGKTIAQAPSTDYFGNTIPLYGNIDLGAAEFVCSAIVNPSITIATTNSNVCSGVATLFTVSSVSAGNNPTYQWKINGAAVSTSASNYSTASLSNGDTISCNVNTNNALCFSSTSATSNNLIMNVGNLFTGATSTNWSDAYNWCTNSIPTSTSNVIIAANSTRFPTISSSASTNQLRIDSGALLTVTGTLQIAGSITNKGSFEATNGTITLNGTNQQTIPANTFSKNTLQNLTINNNWGVNLLGNLNVTGTLTPTAGTLNTNGFLILKSTNNATARIAQGSGNYLIGNVTVERYIPSKTSRKYSFIGCPIVGTSFRNSWQKQIYITGKGNGGSVCGSSFGNGGATDTYNCNGFDKTNTNAASIFSYEAALTNNSHWQSISHTDSLIKLGLGYRVNIRGDRTLGNCNNQLNSTNPTSPTDVTLSATGSIGMGNITVALNNSTQHIYTLLANPYPSPISFSAFRASNSNTIQNKCWTYSPNGNGNYTTYFNGIATNAATGYSNTSIDNLSSGQAFFVENANSSTVVFQESHKTSNTPLDNQYFGNSQVKYFKLRLKNTSNEMLDEIAIQFTNNGSNVYNASTDAISFSNAPQTLSCIKSGKQLAIASYQLNQSTHTIPLKVKSSTIDSFFFTISYWKNIDSNITIKLIDHYLGKETILNTQKSIPFSISNDTATQGSNRFELFVQQPTLLSNNFIKAQATFLKNQILLQWNKPLIDNYTISKYEIERSINGYNFYPIHSVLANEAAEYYDKYLPSNSSNIYYRIVCTSNNNHKIFSQTLHCIIPPSSVSFIHCQMNASQKLLSISIEDNHSFPLNIRIVNELGQTIYSNSKCTNNQTNINCNQWKKGLFLIEVIDNNGRIFREKVVY